MGRTWIAVLPLLAACAQDRMNLLEREMLLFRATNEEARVEALEDRYRAAREKADRLSDRVLKVIRARDELYARYDRGRADLARVEHQRQTTAAALKRVTAERDKLVKAVAAEKQAVSDLEAKLAAARKRRDALATSKGP